MERQLPTIGIQRTGDVLTAVIDNPRSDLNTVDGQLHEDLTALFRMLRREDEARVAILTGSGRAFSAGGDSDGFPLSETPNVSIISAGTPNSSSGIWWMWKSP